MNPVIELVILGAVAVFVIMRLYSVFGTKTGAPPPRPRDNGQPTERTAGEQPKVVEIQSMENEADGVEKIMAIDPAFSSREFMRGARSAYQMIVNAFAEGDRDALRPLLSDEVFDAYDRSIVEREETGAKPLELLRLKRATLLNADADGSVATVDVSFEAELGDDERTRNTREVWTFERDLNSGDPNWRLTDVSTAS